MVELVPFEQLEIYFIEACEEGAKIYNKNVSSVGMAQYHPYLRFHCGIASSF